MNGLFLFVFIAEIWGVMFLVWCAFHEEKLIKIERKIGRIWRFYACKVKQAVRERNAAK